VSALDTTNGSMKIELQVLRPCGIAMDKPLEINLFLGRERIISSGKFLLIENI
jgi:hypothetical protein